MMNQSRLFYVLHTAKKIAILTRGVHRTTYPVTADSATVPHPGTDCITLTHHA